MAVQIYIASQDERGGILRCSLTGDGRLRLIDKTELDRPSYLCAEGNRLYALMREPFKMQSGMMTYEIEKGGGLARLSGPEPVHGPVAAHIAAFRGRVYCVNYLGGSTILMPDKLISHKGSGPNARRQDCSHPHSVTISPDEKHVCICDLGTDSIYVYTLDMEFVSAVSLPPGSGPRHMVFSKDGKHAYCSCELDCAVAALSYEQGELVYIASFPIVPEDSRETSSASAIRLSPDGETLYASSRGYGSVCVFGAEGGRLIGLGHYRVPGAAFREFNISGDYLLCGDESAGMIYVFSVRAGFGAEPVSAFPALRPWCILPLDIA